MKIEQAARKVLEKFEEDEAAGYRSRDRQFAIGLLRKAFESASLGSPETPQEDAPPPNLSRWACGASATGLGTLPVACPVHGSSCDLVCEHGTAMDVHCCDCHSGFLFDADSCVCKLTSGWEKAVRMIIADPYGCPMCDSGMLRDATKEHWDTCGFAFAQRLMSVKQSPSLLAAAEGRVREALEHARTFCLDVRTAGDASGSRIRYNAIALTDELEAALAPLAEPPAPTEAAGQKGLQELITRNSLDFQKKLARLRSDGGEPPA